MRSIGEGKGIFVAPRELREAIEAAFSEDRFPGPWRRQGVVEHDHPLPLCWGNPMRDCTLRVVRQLDQGATALEVAARFGMTRQKLMDRLRERGIRTVRPVGLTPSQRRVMQQLRDHGMTLADISALVGEITGRHWATSTIAKQTTAARIARVKATFTVSTQCVDAIQFFASEMGLTPSRALEALMIQLKLMDEEGTVDDAVDDAGKDKGTTTGQDVAGAQTTTPDATEGDATQGRKDDEVDT